ncbi:MAG: ferritin [Candidatus Cloacimonadota bacterium]|nr:MAG: ferritin [Candidatus Cloacimonadota bacterium]
MISEKLEKAINNQINKEMFSAYYYYSMAAYLETIGLSGFANFFKIQVAEERYHTDKFFKYLNERGGTVRLEAIAKPPADFGSALHVFELALQHEEYVTKSINDVMALAVEEKDFATVSFLNWFVDEQVEEEATMNEMVNHLKLINGEGKGVLLLDRELAKRTFTPPEL